MALITVAGVWLAAHFLDRRRLGDLGLRPDRRWWLEFGAGVALGFVLITAVFLVELAAGWAKVKSFGVLDAGGVRLALELLAATCIWGSVALYEELLTRGYALRNLAEALHHRWWGPGVALGGAVLLTSVAFGLFHGINPNATLPSLVNIALAGVLLFGVPWALTGRLGLPIGLHFSWNFAQGTLFGYPVSGQSLDAHPLIRTVTDGPEFWTGGAFGPEGGWLGVLALLAGFLLILGILRLTDGPLRWRGDLAVYVRPAPSAPAGGERTPERVLPEEAEA
jgi:membrane protease YdiL (CAAX protease family)